MTWRLFAHCTATINGIILPIQDAKDKSAGYEDLVDVESLLDARYHQRTWWQSWDPYLAWLLGAAESERAGSWPFLKGTILLFDCSGSSRRSDPSIQCFAVGSASGRVNFIKSEATKIAQNNSLSKGPLLMHNIHFCNTSQSATSIPSCRPQWRHQILISIYAEVAETVAVPEFNSLSWNGCRTTALFYC